MQTPSPLPVLRPFALLSALLLGCLCLTATPSAFAQSTDAPARFDLQFPGGSPDALVKLLREASGQPVNAMVPLAAKDVDLPPLNYRNVTVEEVLGPLRASENVPFERDGQVFVESEGFEWKLDRGIWVMRVFAPSKQLDVFLVEPVNIRRLLEHYTIDDVTTAIDSAWKLQNAPAENQLLFHPETSLLLLRGRRDDIITARSVLQSLEIKEPPAYDLPISINVLGAVNQPGSFPLQKTATLIHAIAKAGGVTKIGDKRKITIRREGEDPPQTLVINLDDILNGKSPATPLQSGDTIFVPERLL